MAMRGLRGRLAVLLLAAALLPATIGDLERLERIAESEPQSALALAAELRQRHADDLSLARILNAEASAYAITNQFAKALELSRQAETIAVRRRFQDPLAYALLNQASVLRRLSRWDESYELATRSLKIFEVSGNLRGQLLSANRVSTVLLELESFERGLELNERCLALAHRLQDPREIGRTLSNRAYMHYLQKDYAAMLRYAQLAIDEYARIGGDNFIRHPLINAGVANLELGRLAEAEELLQRSLPISRQAQDRTQEMIALKFLARAHKNQGRLAQARDEGMAALAIARDIDNRFEARNAGVELSDILARLGDYRAAYEQLAAAALLQEELSLGAVKERIARAQGQREIEWRESQIKLLQQQQTIAALRARQQRGWRNLLLAIASLLLLAAVLTLRALLAARKANAKAAALAGELQSVDKMVRDINREFQLSDLVDTIFRHVLKLLPQTEQGVFLFLDEDKKEFRPISRYGLTATEAAAHALPAIEAARRFQLNAHTMASGIHLMRDAAGCRATLALDLQAEGRSQGYLVFFNHSRADAFDAADSGQLARIREHLISAVSKARHMERLQQVSCTDALTGLLNRRGMLDRLGEEMDRFQRFGSPFALLLGDLDDFRRINDVHGRECGDLVLGHVAEALAAGVRRVDRVARWDGGQFLLLLPQTGAEQARLVAHKLGRAVKAGRLHSKGLEIAPAMTFGISECAPGVSLEDLLRQAEDALRAGKRQGKDCAVVTPRPSKPAG